MNSLVWPFKSVYHFFRRYPWILVAGIILIFILSHYFWMGFSSWDGFVYKIPPIVELIQHGNFDSKIFQNIYLEYPFPFLEYIHYPFLALAGLKGLFFSYSLTLLPLSLLGVYLFIRELTHEARWAFLGAVVFFSVPFVNDQPFSGYYDFAVIGALAFYLYALLRLSSVARVTWKEIAVAAGATLVLSFSRQQEFAVALFWLVAILALTLFEHRKDSPLPWKRIGLCAGVVCLALIPVCVRLALRWAEYGSPIYPWQIQIPGILNTTGASMQVTMEGSGLVAPTLMGYLKSSYHSWLKPTFDNLIAYDSRNFGAGFLAYFAAAGLLLYHKYSLRQWWIFVCMGLNSLLLLDFWLPRYAVTLVLLMVIWASGAIQQVNLRRRYLPGYLLLALVVVQLFGDEINTALVEHSGEWYLRSNFSQSALFISQGGPALPVYPDQHWNMILVSATEDYILPIYGERLTNQFVAGADLNLDNASCAEVDRQYTRLAATNPERPLVIIDQDDHLASRCRLRCVQTDGGACLAYAP